MGNHSYSHPYFSKISLSECAEEIFKTERLIEECYEMPHVERPVKIIRLPFGDRGGEFCKILSSIEEKDKAQRIQRLLKNEKFIPLDFACPLDHSIDAFWHWDTEDYIK